MHPIAVGDKSFISGMALEIVEGSEVPKDEAGTFRHACPLPWPVDPNMSEGHLCECGRRWTYQPAHWEPLYSIEEIRARQRTGEYGRMCL